MAATGVEDPLPEFGEGPSFEELSESATTTLAPDPREAPLLKVSRLDGEVAIVTGGSSGIGRAVALELARSGVHIAFCFLDTGAKSRVEAQQVIAELGVLGVRVYSEACDVRSSTEVDAFVGKVNDELGGVHILVNNAGVARDRALWRMSDEEWSTVLDTNLTGAFFFTRAVTPLFRSQEYGKVVNIASVHGFASEFGITNYSSSKAGMIGLTKSSALELGRSNVNVNAVAPGYIRTTELTSRVPAETLDRAREESVLGRLGDPQDVANVVLFLVSEAARHITGAVIPVDGGYLL